MKAPFLIAVLLTAQSLSPAFADESATMDPRFLPVPAEPACHSLMLASTGGPTLKDPKALAIRWLGFSTYELVYGGKILLLDNYYDRGPRYRDLGFRPADVRRADLILVGHAHSDHMSDTAETARQTGAPVIAAPITADKLLSEGIDEKQIRRVSGKGGELLRFPGFTVEPILARHGEPGLEPASAQFNTAYRAAAPASPAEAAAEAAINAKGSQDRRILDEGTIAYIITFDSGFRIAYRDSGGFITDYEKAVLARIGRVDILIGAIAANGIAESNAAILMPMVETYRPAVYFPAHHEEEVGRTVDRATEPMFQVIKNKFPDTITISREFREPTCFDTRYTVGSTIPQHRDH